MTAGLNLQTFGQGERAALALHCSLAHGGAWAGAMAFLDDDVTMVAPDLPGHGRSPDWDGTGDYIAHCAAAAGALIAGAGAGEGAVDLIGHSGGAVIALQVALARPEAIRTLTLIEPTLFAAARGTPSWGDMERLFAPFEAALDAGDRAGAARAFLQVWGAVTPWEGMDARTRGRFADRIHLIRASQPALYRDSGNILGAGRLEALQMPVTLVAGMTSPVICREITRALAARMPDAMPVVVPEAGHMLPLTHPEVTAALIAGTLQRA